MVSFAPVDIIFAVLFFLHKKVSFCSFACFYTAITKYPLYPSFPYLFGSVTEQSFISAEHNTYEVSEGGSANLTRLSANTTYRVWVRARSPHSAVPADSSPLRITTYAQPEQIILQTAEAEELRVSWPPPTQYQLHE